MRLLWAKFREMSVNQSQCVSLAVQYNKIQCLWPVCSDPESVRSERHSNWSGLQDEWPGGTEVDGGVELLLPNSTSAERGKWRKGNRTKQPGLWSKLSCGSGGHRRYGESLFVCWIWASVRWGEKSIWSQNLRLYGKKYFAYSVFGTFLERYPALKAIFVSSREQ